ncbi:hypothetical protein NESM_000659700 [Novymonas esmeraldas]|uniref:Uncharacterized protein n=1 Tax=Novymonas esmeraldas TaxID=1808958 RepID=A0AAW0ETS5_9TRYP
MMMRPVQQRRMRRGCDFVLIDVPVLDSPEWSDEDQIDMRRTPPHMRAAAAAQAAAAAARQLPYRGMFSPAALMPPMGRFASPMMVQSVAPPQAGFNHPGSYEAAARRHHGRGGANAAIAANRIARHERRARGGGVGFGDVCDDRTTAAAAATATRVCSGAAWSDTDGGGSSRGDDEEEAEEEDEEQEEEDSGAVSPLQPGIGSFAVPHTHSRFRFHGGSLFFHTSRHAGLDAGREDEDEDEAVATSDDSSDESRHSRDSTSSSSFGVQRHGSIGFSSHDHTHIGVAVDGDGHGLQQRRRPPAPSYGGEPAPSLVAGGLPQPPSEHAAARPGLLTTTTVSAAPSIFRTFFDDEDGDEDGGNGSRVGGCVYGPSHHHHGDSVSASHRNGAAPPSMMVSAFPMPAAVAAVAVVGAADAAAGGATASAVVPFSYGRQTDTVTHTATGTESNSGNQTDTVTMGGDAAQPHHHHHGAFSNKRQGSFLMAMEEVPHDAPRTNAALPRSPNPAAVSVEAPHRYGGDMSTGQHDANSRPSRRSPTGLRERASGQPRAGLHGASAEAAHPFWRDGSPAAPSGLGERRRRTTPGDRGGADDRGCDEESWAQEQRSRFQESVYSRRHGARGGDAVEVSRDEESGFFYPGAAWARAPQHTGVPLSAAPAPPSLSSKMSPNERANFRHRIAPRGQATAALPPAPTSSSTTSRRGSAAVDGVVLSPELVGVHGRSSGGFVGAVAGAGERDEYGLLAWAGGSPLRSSGGVADAAGSDGGAEVVVVAGQSSASRSGAVGTAAQPLSAKAARRVSHGGASPHTAVVTIVDGADISAAVQAHHTSHVSTPAASSTTQDAHSRPRSPSTTASLLFPAAYSMVAVMAGTAGSSTTTQSGSVAWRTSSEADAVRTARANSLYQNDDYCLLNSFRGGVPLASSTTRSGGDDGASDGRAPLSPWPMPPGSPRAGVHMMGDDQRRLSGSSAGDGAHHNYPTSLSTPTCGQQQQQQQQRPVLPPVSGKAAPLHASVPALASQPAAPRAAPATPSSRGAVHPEHVSAPDSLEDDYELLSLEDEVVIVATAAGGCGDGLATFAPRSVPAAARKVGVVRSTVDEVCDGGDSIENSSRRQRSTSIVSAEEVQAPRAVRGTTQRHRGGHGLLQDKATSRSFSPNKVDGGSKAKRSPLANGRASAPGLTPSLSATAFIAPPISIDGSSQPPPSLSTPVLPLPTSLHSSEQRDRRRITGGATAQPRSPRNSSRASQRLKTFAKRMTS